MTISLCSGCVHYYSYNCAKSMDEMALVRSCDHFCFVPTRNFRRPAGLYLAINALPEFDPHVLDSRADRAT